MIRLDVAALDRLVARLEAGVDDLAAGLEALLADDQARARVAAAASAAAPRQTGLLR